MPCHARAMSAFECPRCGTTVEETFYGPCLPCREALRAALGGEQREVVATPFEPTMHVTPNAVAQKE